MAEDHETFVCDPRQLLIAQVLQKQQIDELLKVTTENSKQVPALDARVDNLVSAIGKLIERLPYSVAIRLEQKLA